MGRSMLRPYKGEILGEILGETLEPGGDAGGYVAFGVADDED